MKIFNLPYWKKLQSNTTSEPIILFFFIIVVDILLLVHHNLTDEAIGMAFIGILYMAFIIFPFTEKQKSILHPPLLFLTIAFLSFMHGKHIGGEGNYFYLFPATLGYINSSVNSRFGVKSQIIYLLLFSIAAILVIQFFIFPSKSGSVKEVTLYNYRLIVSFIMTAFLSWYSVWSKISSQKENKEKFFQDALFQSYTEAYILFKKETLEITDYNDHMVQMFKLPDDTNLRGLYVSQVMIRYLAEDSPNLELLMNNIPDDWVGEAIFLTFTKKKFNAYVKSMVYKNDAIRYQLISIMDISEITKAREELLVYKEKMDKAAEAKARFLSSMSHELRTPLNGIIGTSNLILGETGLTENIKNHITILRYSSEHMLGIINDILDFSKIDAGKLELKRNMFSLIDSLEKLIKSFENEFKNKNIELLFSCDPVIGKLNIVGDQLKLNQVLANLLSNALKFTIAGRVMLNVTADVITEKKATLSFEVKDTGIGMVKEKHEEIFQDFVQLNNGGSRNFEGTGLGLTISEKLVNIFGGKLQVESEIKKGSRFYFTISLDIAPEKQVIKQEVTTNGIAPDIRGVRVLIVEDNEINAGILKSFLLKWKIRIKEARNGIHALELLKYHKFDLILMDLEMPEMDGYTTLKIIRQTDTRIPVIAFTATLLENMDALVDESGFNDYILKPFKPSDLKLKIEYYVPHRKIDYA